MNQTASDRLRLLGSFELVHRGVHVTLGQSRLEELLALLAIQPGGVLKRPQIAYHFWPDSGEQQARTNTRNLLHKLKHAWPNLGDAITINGDAVTWRYDAVILVDVHIFAQWQVQVEQSNFPKERLRGLANAVDCYRGDFLPGCYADWALAVREQLRTRYTNVLEALVEALLDLRQNDEALDRAKQLRDHDPLYESAYRRLMHIHALLGDRAAALRVYHDCAAMLRKELGVEPAPATQQLYVHLLQRDASTEQPLDASQPIQRTRLVGRHAEWQQLQQAWRTAQDGRAQAVILWGEAGIGTTRLAEELLDWAGRLGHTWASSRAYAVSGGLSYAPVADWLRTPRLRSAIEALDDLWRVELARLLPELLSARPDLPRPGPLTEAWQQQRFFQSVTQALQAAPGPLLLHLDNMQWSDEDTLHLLQFLLYSVRGHPLLVLGTLRTEDVVNHEPLAAMLKALRHNHQLTELRLGPLSREETRKLAEQTTGAAITPELAAALYASSEGNPLYLVETLQGWLDGAAAPLADPVMAQSLGAARIPPNIYAVIAARLGQLSPMAQQVASTAAVIGRDFTYTVLQAAMAVDELPLVDALDELWQRRIIREQEGESYDFSHDRIREVAYQQISRARRRLLHRQVAAALERLHPAGLDAISGRLAAHYEAAGNRTQAVHYYTRAGEHALSSFVPRAALDFFEQAAVQSQTAEQKADALHGLGQAHLALVQPTEAIHAFRQALGLVATADPRRGRMLYTVTNVSFSILYDLDTAESYLQQALTGAEAAETLGAVGQGIALRGPIDGGGQGEWCEDVRLIQHVLPGTHRSDNNWCVGRILADLAFLQGQRGDFDAAAASAHRALELLNATNDRAGVAFAWNLLGQAAGGRGAYSAAFDAFRHSEENAAAIDQRSLLAQIPNLRGWLHQQLCDYVGALALDQAGVVLAQEWGQMTAEISARLNVCLDLCELGEAAQALHELEQLEQKIGERQFGFHAWRWRLRLLHTKGLCYLALGRNEEALTAGETGLALAQSAGAQKYVALCHTVAGAALADLNQAEAGVPHLQLAVAMADEIGYQPLRWQGRWRLAQVTARSEEREQAAVLLAEAAAIVHTIAAALSDEGLRGVFLAARPVWAILTGDLT